MNFIREQSIYMLRVALIGLAFDVKGRKTYAPDVSK